MNKTLGFIKGFISAFDVQIKIKILSLSANFADGRQDNFAMGDKIAILSKDVYP